jgi:hypothetical protein
VNIKEIPPLDGLIILCMPLCVGSAGKIFFKVGNEINIIMYVKSAEKLKCEI